MNAASLLMVLALFGGGLSPKDSTPVRYVVVFDFACAERAAYGAQLADSVRVRLRRHGEYKVIDRLTTAEFAPEGGVSLATPDKKIIGLLKERIGAHLAVFGSVQKLGRNVRAEIRCVDASGSRPAAWTEAFSDDTERARGEIARRIVEAVRRRPEWKPPQYGDETVPKQFGKPLNLNGGFESAKLGWRGPDNVSTFIVADPRPGKKGKLLRIFTNLERDAWLKYQRDLRMGKADPDKPPTIGTVANKATPGRRPSQPGDLYATVAALEGVHYRSVWIPARPGWRYWLVADMKGRTAGIFFPKILVKGYADFSALADAISEVSLGEMKMTPDQFAALPRDRQDKLIAADAKAHPDRYRRVVYRWYLACRNEENVWKHYAAPFPPRGGLPRNVRWLRIEVYAYWPPGEYLFDDVHLYRDPRTTAPVAVERPRTPHYKPPSTQPAKP